MKKFTIINKNISISPRKLLVIANTVRNKDVSVSLENLKLSLKNSKSVRIMHKVLQSSYNQFVNKNKEKKNFEKKTIILESVKIDKGIVRKKTFFRAKGRSDVVKNRKSHITVSFVAK